MYLFSDPGRIFVDKMLGVFTGKKRYRFDGTDTLLLPDSLKSLHQ